MNKMADVAKMFGKKMGESFEIKFPKESGAGWDRIFICTNPRILEALRRHKWGKMR